MIRISSEALRYMIEKYLEEQGIEFDTNFRFYAVRDGQEPIIHPSLEVFFDENCN